MAKLTIAYFSNAKLPSMTANSIQIMKMCEAFAELGHEVFLIAFSNNLRDVENSYNINIYDYYNVKFNFKIIVSQTFKNTQINRFLNLGIHLLNFLRIKKTIDLVYTRSIQAALICSLFNFPFIFEVHAIPSNYFRFKAEHFVLKSKSLLRIVFISKSLKKAYEQIFNIKKNNNYIVAHDGADPIDCNKIKYNNLKLKGRSSVMRAGYFGSFHPGKGLEIVTKLAPLLPDWDFHVFGGSDKDIAFFQKKYNYNNLYWYGFVPPVFSRYYQCKMDVLLLPAQRSVKIGGKTDIARWMSPLKLFEYMATGRPIVASNLPVISEVLQHNVNALLVEPDNINMWVEALKRLKNDLNLRKKIGVSAKKLFQKEYAWKNRAEKVLNGLF